MDKIVNKVKVASNRESNGIFYDLQEIISDDSMVFLFNIDEEKEVPIPCEYLKRNLVFLTDASKVMEITIGLGSIISIESNVLDLDTAYREPMLYSMSGFTSSVEILETNKAYFADKHLEYKNMNLYKYVHMAESLYEKLGKTDMQVCEFVKEYNLALTAASKK